MSKKVDFIGYTTDIEVPKNGIDNNFVQMDLQKTSEINVFQKLFTAQFGNGNEYLSIGKIRLSVPNCKKKDVHWFNLQKKKGSNQKYHFFPCLVNHREDVILHFSKGQLIMDITLPKLVFDLKDPKLNVNEWVQLRNAVKKLLNIDIKKAKIKKLVVEPRENLYRQGFFYENVILKNFALEKSGENGKKFVSVGKEIEYSLRKTGAETMKEKFVLQKSHNLFDEFNYSDFMQSDIETELIYIILQCRRNLRIHN